MPNISRLTPVFTLQTRSCIRQEGLFDLFERVVGDDLVDLPVMQPHQRASSVTVLAIIMTVLKKYAKAEPVTALQWEAEWNRQIGSDALRLVAPEDERAFLQPPTAGANTALWNSEVDVTFMQQVHEAKPQISATVEQCLFGLMASSWRQHGGVGRYAGARDGVAVVLPSLDGTIGSEIKLLAQAYTSMPAGEVGRDTSPVTAADHMLWLQTYDKESHELTLTECPHPCLDARAIRLKKHDGRISAFGATVKKRRITKGGNLADPHVPLIDGEPYRLVKGRRFDAKFQHASLFGSLEVQRPRILDLVEYRLIRLCALGTDPPGKTKGYWELTVNAGRRRSLFRLSPQKGGDRPGELSQRMLGVLDIASGKVLRPALATLHELESVPGKADSIRQVLGAYTTQFRKVVTAKSLEIVLDLISTQPDPGIEQRAMHQAIHEPLMRVFRRAEATVADPLRRARAELRLDGALRNHNMEPAKMKDDKIPLLARQVYAILNEMVKHLTPDGRAGLRTMSLSEPPLSYWMLLSAVPVEQVENTAAERVWRVTLRALGRLRLGGPGIGTVLAETEMPEMRVQRLLMATGVTLTDAIADTARWLIAQEAERGVLSDLVTLGLGDAMEDSEALEWARRRIALDYAREAGKKSVEKLWRPNENEELKTHRFQLRID